MEAAKKEPDSAPVTGPARAHPPITNHTTEADGKSAEPNEGTWTRVERRKKTDRSKDNPTSTIRTSEEEKVSGGLHQSDAPQITEGA